MNPSVETLRNKLIDFEKQLKTSEFDIENDIRKLRNKHDTSKPCPEWEYETMAFSFMEKLEGSYFQPQSEMENEKGKFAYPDINQIDTKCINYWKIRAQETQHPIFRARYTGLIWEYEKNATGNRPDFTYAKDCIEAFLEIAGKQLLDHERDIIIKLGRALKLSLTINNKEFVKKSKNAILDYESIIPRGIDWAFSFDYLVKEKNVKLTEVEEVSIISNLEKALSTKVNDSHQARHIGERLTEYYRSKGHNLDLERVVRFIGGLYRDEAHREKEPLRAEYLLNEAHKFYQQFNMQEESEEVLKEIREIGPEVIKSFKPVFHSFEIPESELEEIVQSFIQNDEITTLRYIAAYFTPDPKTLEEQLREQKAQTPLSQMIPKQQYYSDGRKGSTIEDPEDRIIELMSNNLVFDAHLLNTVLTKVIDHYGIKEDTLTQYFEPNLLLKDRLDFIASGVSFYLQKRYDAAIHLLIPQIEASIRTLYELSGGTVLKENRYGGYNLKTLDELLRSNEVKSVLGERISLYLRVLLTDSRAGWGNFRNDVCHGILTYDRMKSDITDRLIHALLLIQMVRPEETDPKPEDNS